MIYKKIFENTPHLGEFKILYKSFQIILSKEMNSENQEVIYCADDDEYRVNCEICDKFCIERFYKNHLKSGTHTNNFYKRQQLNN